MKPDYECKKCKSPRLLLVRLDSDWGDGGDVTKVNGDSFYEENDDEDRPDIYIYHCLACGHQEG